MEGTNEDLLVVKESELNQQPADQGQENIHQYDVEDLETIEALVDDVNAFTEEIALENAS